MIKREYYGSELEEEGIVYFDFRQHSYMQYHSKKHNEISAQVADKDGRIWLGTYHEGIMRSDQPYAKSRPLNFFSCGQSKRSPGVLCNQRFMF